MKWLVCVLDWSFDVLCMKHAWMMPGRRKPGRWSCPFALHLARESRRFEYSSWITLDTDGVRNHAKWLFNRKEMEGAFTRVSGFSSFQCWEAKHTCFHGAWIVENTWKYHKIMNCCFERSFTCVYKDIKLVSASGKTRPFEVMRPADLTAAWIKVTPSGGPAQTSEYLRYVTTVTGKPIGFDMTQWLWCCETDMDEITVNPKSPNPTHEVFH